MESDYLQLECLYTDNDGTTTGSARDHLSISEAEFPGAGPTEIISLSTFPLDRLPDGGTDKKKMMSERGKWFCDLLESDPAFQQYQGLVPPLR